MGDRRANAAAEVVAARAALEAALDAEGVSEDAVANLAEQYAVALMKGQASCRQKARTRISRTSLPRSSRWMAPSSRRCVCSGVRGSQIGVVYFFITHRI